MTRSLTVAVTVPQIFAGVIAAINEPCLIN